MPALGAVALSARATSAASRSNAATAAAVRAQELGRELPQDPAPITA
jgi:hypothetical protein